MNERLPLPYAWDDVRARLQRDIRRLLGRLFPGERIPAGQIFAPKNPTRNDRRAGSFVIWMQSGGEGAWREYATGEKGDIFDLILYIERLHENIDAYWWALDFLGLGRGVVRNAEQDAVDRQRRERDRRAADAKLAADNDEKSAALFKTWLALAPWPGTLVETYLAKARRIPVDRLRHPPGALRFAPALDHLDNETGEVTTWPAMVSAMTRGKKVVALHTTWLAPDGMGKAPVTKAKKMRGPVKDGQGRAAAIRLTAGPSGLSPTAAADRGVKGPLAISEGIETGLTVAVARPDYRVWAAGSLDFMGMQEWPACASAVVLLRDNDWHVTALKAFERVEARWRDQAKGRPVVVASSAVGSDFNDWVRR